MNRARRFSSIFISVPLALALSLLSVASADASSRTHVVRAGETLYRIAQRYRVSIEAITTANGLADPERIQPGQRLIIPTAGPGTRDRGPARTKSTKKTSVSKSATFRHTVRRGDTLSSIARSYRTTVNRLVNLNELKSDRLQIGQRLLVPGRLPARSVARRRPASPTVTFVPPPAPPPSATMVAMPELVVGGEVLAPTPMRVRRGPKEFYPTLAIVAPDTPLRLISEENGWYEVQLPNGETGYVFVDDFKVEVSVPGSAETQELHGSDVVREAVRYLGIRYVWGGTSDRGMDCSGFIYLVFHSRVPGLERLRSYDYYRMGTAVSRDSLAPGDLVFFSTYARGPSHVGIYLGEGKFIHASSGAGAVTITLMDHPYYTARYVGARRLVRP